MSVRFRKYGALGNDYLVLTEPRFTDRLTAANVQQVCDPANGPAADGVLAAVDAPGCVGVRIWNSDGSRAEKSGNGLRIFARYLWDLGQVDEGPFCITTDAGDVRAQVLDEGNRVRVEMGPVTISGKAIMVAGEHNRQIECVPASVGNPHCVCFVESPTAALAQSLGPAIENMPAFPNRTNVQFVTVRSRSEIQMEIWERGSGYTLSSGTSAIAAVAVCRQRGHVDQAVAVVMPGGTLAVTLDDDYFATIEGPVEKLDECEFPASLFT
jgi:diaminopimelate epimerase